MTSPRATTTVLSLLAVVLAAPLVPLFSDNVEAQAPDPLSWTTVGTTIAGTRPPSLFVEDTVWILSGGDADTTNHYTKWRSTDRFTTHDKTTQIATNAGWRSQITERSDGSYVDLICSDSGAAGLRRTVSGDDGATWGGVTTDVATGNHCSVVRESGGGGVAFDDQSFTYVTDLAAKCILKSTQNGGTSFTDTDLNTMVDGCGYASHVGPSTAWITWRASDLIRMSHTTDKGVGWTTSANVDSTSGNHNPFPCASNDTIAMVVWQAAVGQRFGVTTDAGLTFTVGTIAATASTEPISCISIDADTYVVSWVDSTTDDVFYAWTTNQGVDWTTGVVWEGTAAEIAYGWPGIGFDAARGQVVLSWPEEVTQHVRVAFADVPGFVPVCTGTDTCNSLLEPETSFRDARTTFTPFATLLVREDGVPTDQQPDTSGRLLQFDADLGLTTSVHPCSGGEAGSVPWEYTPDDGFGLAVTADERVVVSCLAFVEVNPRQVQSRLKVLTNSSLSSTELSIALTTSESAVVTPPWALDRLDSAYSTALGFVTREQRGLTIDAQSLVFLACDTTGVLTGLGIDVRTNRTATVSDKGLKVWPNTQTTGCLPIVSSGSVTGTKTAIHENRVVVGRSTDTRVYDWSVSGFTLDATNTSLGLSDDHEADIRYSKDGDFLVWWTGSTMRVLNETDLETLSGPHSLSGGTINGCDMDVLNNYVYCVTDNLVHRVAVHGDVPSFFGNPKDGNFTDPAGVGDPFTEDPSIFTSGDQDAGTVGDTFIGVDTAAGVGVFGETGLAAFLALILIGGMAFVFYGAFAAVSGGIGGAAPGVGAGIGAFVGLVVAVGFEVISLLWAVLLGLVAIAATVFVIWRR